MRKAGKAGSWRAAGASQLSPAITAVIPMAAPSRAEGGGGPGWAALNGLCVFALSTVFLMGPMKQLKRMFEPTRLIATIMVLVRPAL